MHVHHRLAAVALTFASAIAAHGQSTVTREQVKAEVLEARRSGQLLSGGEASLRLNELFPGQYPRRQADAPGKSRAQVRAELDEARRVGDLVAGESSLRKNERLPLRYPVAPAGVGKTREAVKEELALARRLGDLQVGEDSRTLAERFPARYEAERARHAEQMRHLAGSPPSRVAASMR
jgi:hypothetical protein